MRNVNSDAAYKMMFLEYPLILNGSTDFTNTLPETLLKRYCREILIHIINWIGIRHESFSTILVADEEPSITNGLTAAFGGKF